MCTHAKSGIINPKINPTLLLSHLEPKSTIKAVQSDWGREFRPFTKFLTQNGIQHRLICPHTHHQNGVVERKHRNIVELGLTLLS